MLLNKSLSKILIIEDDFTLNDQLARLLNDQGFSVRQCHDGQKGLLAALNGTFDLILLDVLLPAINGFSVLKQIRSVKHTPVMMLTACGAESERIEGYSKGADDYLPKPFSFTELGLRIEALLRRSRPQPEYRYNKSTIISIDEMIVCRKSQQVTYTNQSISLTPIQFQLLLILVEHHQQVLTKPYLYQVILKRPYSRYDRSVDMHLSRIRKKLVSAGMPPERLATVHGKGYQFI